MSEKDFNELFGKGETSPIEEVNEVNEGEDSPIEEVNEVNEEELTPIKEVTGTCKEEATPIEEATGACKGKVISMSTKKIKKALYIALGGCIVSLICSGFNVYKLYTTNEELQTMTGKYKAINANIEEYFTKMHKHMQPFENMTDGEGKPTVKGECLEGATELVTDKILKQIPELSEHEVVKEAIEKYAEAELQITLEHFITSPIKGFEGMQYICVEKESSEEKEQLKNKTLVLKAYVAFPYFYKTENTRDLYLIFYKDDTIMEQIQEERHIDMNK